MKIILSRKGFDSGAGGCASPLFGDGTMISLPIPERKMGHLCYGDITNGTHDLGQVVNDLVPTNKRDFENSNLKKKLAHLDPWIDDRILINGQAKNTMGFGPNASAHLLIDKDKVGPGDLILFFGWFKEVVLINGKYCFNQKAPDIHAIWGFMYVGDVIAPSDHKNHPKLIGHPHYEEDHIIVPSASPDCHGQKKN